MYSVTVTLVRPNTSVPFMNPDAQSLLSLKNAEFQNLLDAASGFLGVVRTHSPDDLTLTVVSNWESPEAHAAFVAANQNLVLQRKALRNAYYADSGILATVTKG